jgi:hypothetical protein
MLPLRGMVTCASPQNHLNPGATGSLRARKPLKMIINLKFAALRSMEFPVFGRKTSMTGGAIHSLGPTIFHITAHKAGSQWIRQLLSMCAPERIVEPQLYVAHFLKNTIKSGYIYPTVYVTKTEFDRVAKPKFSKHFVILRDLRDILVSGYFSLRYSHAEQGEIPLMRKALNDRSTEEGMLWALDRWLETDASICSSWINSEERWIRYEDLLENDIEILEELLIEECGLEIDRRIFREHVLKCRFSQVSGRSPGEEDVHLHLRKGVAGDWHNYFTPMLKQAFKERYGDLLVKAGYEKNTEW